MEAHVKLRPIDFATDGVFVCGLAHSPKPIDESIAMLGASAERRLSFSQEMLQVGAWWPWWKRAVCSLSDLCEGLSYNVPVINAKGEAEIDLRSARLRSCAAECLPGP